MSVGLADKFKDGESLAEVCADIGICFDAYKRAKELSPLFAEADKKGRMLSEAWWTRLGRAGAIGQKPIQPATWCFNMKNRFGWRDKIDQQVTGSEGGAVKTDSKITVEFVNAKDKD